MFNHISIVYNCFGIHEYVKIYMHVSLHLLESKFKFSFLEIDKHKFYVDCNTLYMDCWYYIDFFGTWLDCPMFSITTLYVTMLIVTMLTMTMLTAAMLNYILFTLLTVTLLMVFILSRLAYSVDYFYVNSYVAYYVT